MKQYKETPFSSKEEENLYKKLKRDLDTASRSETCGALREFHQLGIQNPWKRRAELLSQGKKENTGEQHERIAALAGDFGRSNHHDDR